MNTGLWIDHSRAVIVSISGKKEKVVILESEINRHFRSPTGKNDSSPNGRRNVTPGDIQDRGFAEHMSAFYNKVISSLRGAGAIYILGPGESKGELAKKIQNSGLSGKVVGIETADKMTDHQIAAKIRKYFREQETGGDPKNVKRRYTKPRYRS